MNEQKQINRRHSSFHSFSYTTDIFECADKCATCMNELAVCRVLTTYCVYLLNIFGPFFVPYFVSLSSVTSPFVIRSLVYFLIVFGHNNNNKCCERRYCSCCHLLKAFFIRLKCRSEVWPMNWIQKRFRPLSITSKQQTASIFDLFLNYFFRCFFFSFIHFYWNMNCFEFLEQ